MENQNKVREKAVEFLKNSDTMVVATVSIGGEPHAATVYFTVDQDLNLYFVTHSGTKKHENIKLNKNIAFVVGFGPDVFTVQGGGVVEEMMENYDKFYGEIMEKALKPVDQWPPLLSRKGGHCVFKITPSWMVCLDLHKDSHKEEIEKDFYKII